MATRPVKQRELFGDVQPAVAKARPRPRVVDVPTKPLPRLTPPTSTDDLRRLSGDVTHLLSPALGRRPGWYATPRDVPYVLAVDVGATTGWATIAPNGAIDAGELVDRHQLGDEWSYALAARVRRAYLDARELGAALVVVLEDCFLHTEHPNPQATISLARRIGFVAGVAIGLRVPTWRVPARSWQSRLIGRLPRDAGKARAVERVAEITGDWPSSDHVADAILLAIYARGPHAPLQRKALTP